MTQAGPPGCRFLLAKMTASGTNPGPQPVRAKEATAGTYRKEKSHAGSPTWKQCAFECSYQRDDPAEGKLWRRLGPLGLATREPESLWKYSVNCISPLNHSARVHTQVVTPKFNRYADQKCRVPWTAYSIVLCNTNWFRSPPWCDMDSLTFIL